MMTTTSTGSSSGHGQHGAAKHRHPAHTGQTSQEMADTPDPSTEGYSISVIPIRPQLPGTVVEMDEEDEDVEAGGLHVIGAKPEAASITGSALAVDPEEDGGSYRSDFSAEHLPCGLTRFHFSLAFGMLGFFAFWLGLLLKIYLPKS